MDYGTFSRLLSHPGVDPLLAAFAFLLLFGFTSPIPEELALILAGLSLRAAGRSYLEALSIACLALVLADLAYYSLPRFFGPFLARLPFLRRLLSPERMRQSERYFALKGPRMVFVCRFVLGLRAGAIMSAGFLRMPLKRFLAYDASALLIGAALWLGAGFFIGQRIEAGLGLFGEIVAVCAPLALVVAAVLIYRSVMAERSRLAPLGSEG